MLDALYQLRLLLVEFSLLESSIQNADGSPKGSCQVNTAVQVVL